MDTTLVSTLILLGFIAVLRDVTVCLALEPGSAFLRIVLLGLLLCPLRLLLKTLLYFSMLVLLELEESLKVFPRVLPDDLVRFLRAGLDLRFELVERLECEAADFRGFAELLLVLELVLELVTDLDGRLVADLDEDLVFAGFDTRLGFEVVLVRVTEDLFGAERVLGFELLDVPAVVDFCFDLEEADFFDDRDRSANAVPVKKITIARIVNKLLIFGLLNIMTSLSLVILQTGLAGR